MRTLRAPTRTPARASGHSHLIISALMLTMPDHRPDYKEPPMRTFPIPICTIRNPTRVPNGPGEGPEGPDWEPSGPDGGCVGPDGWSGCSG